MISISVETLRTQQDDPMMQALTTQLVADFGRLVQTGSVLLEQVSQPLSKAGYAKFRLCAHEAKGLALTLGEDRLAARSVAAETGAQNGDQAALAQSWPEFLRDCEAVKNRLEGITGGTS